MKFKINERIAIFGAGGSARETLLCISDILNRQKKNVNDYVSFVVDDEYFHEEKIMGIRVIPFSKFNFNEHLVFISIGDPKLREKVKNRFPEETKYATIVHPTAIVSEWVKLSEGTIITAGSILTCNIEMGKHVHINLHTIISHDCIIGDYFTSAPAVNISGNCKIGKSVYIGANAAVKNGITICDNVIIGMGAVVVKNIVEEGTYVGNPAKKIK